MKNKINISNPLSPLFKYLAIHFGRAKGEKDTEERVLYSLNITGKALLIIGMLTSLTFISMVVLDLLSTSPAWVSVAVIGLVFAVYAAVIDLSIGVNTPYLFSKSIAFFNSPTWGSFSAVLSSALLIGGQCFISMWFSYTGNTYSTEELLKHENPKHNAAALVTLDSSKHKAEAEIRAGAEEAIKTALAADKAEIAKAAKLVEDARHKNALVYTRYTVAGSWDQKQYNKAISKARRDSTALMAAHGNMYKVELNKLDAKIHQSNSLFNHQIDATKRTQADSVAKYERKLATYRLLLRDLGYYATLGFILITFISVLIKNASGSAPTPQRSKGSAPPANNTKQRLLSAKKHLTTNLQRLNDAIQANNKASAETNANALLASYQDIQDIDAKEFERTIKHLQFTQPDEYFIKPDEILAAIKAMP